MADQSNAASAESNDLAIKPQLDYHDEQESIVGPVQHLDDSTEAKSHSQESKDPESGGDPANTGTQVWLASFARTGPLLGLAALLFALLSIPASLAILLASEHRPTDSWKYQPNVYLAILTAISNKGIAFAAMQGLAITWWRQSLKGRRMGDLHRDWSMGQDLWSALTAGRHINFLGLACILVTLTAVDGPLLQRSSTIAPRALGNHVNLTVNLTPELPANLTGSFDSSNILTCAPFSASWQTESPAPGMLAPYLEYVQNHPIQGAVTGCPAVCTTTVRAPALSIASQNSTTVYLNYTAPFTAEEIAEYNDLSLGGLYMTQPIGSPPMARYAFQVSMVSYPGTADQIILRVGGIKYDPTTLTGPQCAGFYTVTDYYLVSAVGEYDVTLNGQVLTFQQPPASPTILALANNTALSLETLNEYASDFGTLINTTLSGIAGVGVFSFQGFFAILNFTDPSTEATSVSQGPFLFTETANWEVWADGTSCVPIWKDPVGDVMAGLNEIMFRAGIWAAGLYVANQTAIAPLLDPGMEPHYTVDGVRIDAQNVFISTYWYFIGATVVNLAAISVVLYTYYGWWRLGRAVSFSPLEIAKAFDAPLLQDVNSNSSADEIEKATAGQRIRYGAVEDSHRLMFADPSVIYEPTDAFEVRE